MIALAVPTGLVALVQGVGAMPLPFNLHVVDARLPGIFKLHMLASGAALVLMPVVIATRRHRTWHRPLGRLAAVLVVAGVVAIRRKQRARHATLMLAMAAVASGAIWIRLTTAVATSWHLPFDPLYACATWLGWLIPLALVLTFAPGPISSGRPLPPRGHTALAT